MKPQVKIAIEKEIRILERRLEKVKAEIEEAPPLEELSSIRNKAYKLISSHQEKRISDSEFLKKLKPLSSRETELRKTIDRILKRDYSALIEKQVEIEDGLSQLRNEIFILDLKRLQIKNLDISLACDSVYCNCDNPTKYKDANGKIYCNWCGRDFEK